MRIGGALSVKELVDMTKKDGGVRMLRGFYDLKFKEVDNGKSKKIILHYTSFKIILHWLNCSITILNVSSCLIRVDVIVEWENFEIKVIRPNLECTNGYIHVIDQVGC